VVRHSDAIVLLQWKPKRHRAVTATPSKWRERHSDAHEIYGPSQRRHLFEGCRHSDATHHAPTRQNINSFYPI